MKETIDRHKLRSKPPYCSLGRVVVVRFGELESRCRIETWNHVWLFVRRISDGLGYKVRFDQARWPTQSELRQHYTAVEAGRKAKRSPSVRRVRA